MFSQEMLPSETIQLQVITMYNQETFQSEANLLQANTMYYQEISSIRDQPIASKYNV